MKIDSLSRISPGEDEFTELQQSGGNRLCANTEICMKTYELFRHFVSV